MKRNKIFNTLLAAGAICLMGIVQSCDDYLTVLPTNQITEEAFWADKNDLNNVRAGAYLVLTQGITNQVLTWGELRSDNLVLNVMDQADYTGLQEAVLKPTYPMFDFATFYRGINYCNRTLERGQRMVDEGTDPSFNQGAWLPIKAEMHALRALYYFYLVRAFRDVPYTTKSITTDKEGREAYDPALPGVALLSDLIDTLEVVKNYAVNNYGNPTDNCGRFTKRSVRTLLADMYLWRGCMLQDYFDKTIREGVDSIVNYSDVKGEDGIVRTVDGTEVNNDYCNAQAKECFQKAIENADWVLENMTAEYKKELDKQANASDELKNQKYPLIQFSRAATIGSISDQVYAELFGQKNSSESIFEIQFDGVNNYNNAVTGLLTKKVSGVITPVTYVVNPVLASVNSVAPDRGFGKADVRLHETMRYTQSNTSVFPFVKGWASSIYVNDLKDMGEGASYNFRNQMDSNWPVYRLSDIMLIKAEAIARFQGESAKNNDDMYEAFDMVNSIFARCNPEARPSTETGSELATARLTGVYRGTSRSTSGYFATDKTGADLLQLVYRERQREYVGEGKFWFDLVRQAEATNDPTTSLTDYIAVTTAVKNRLRHLYSLYCPYYSEEMKVNGVENGGKLVQNPVWARYSNN
ncbi:MAG: RagB/SusD family nutrient uptake outer membrane protein [Alloprevotella sp.]|nr:RagB/SusD family nutrient uptake outer membrane protein [Alloprevotella sp.]